MLASIGFGLYSAGNLLFFTRVGGLPAVDVGIGLSLASVVGVVAAVPGGRWCDIVGPRLLVLSAGALKVATLVFAAFARSFWLFLLLMCVLSIAEQVGGVGRTAFVPALVGANNRARLMAFVRTAQNAGITVGFLLSGLALSLDTKAGFYALIFGHAALTLIATLVFTAVHVPLPERTAGMPRRRWEVLRDGPYISLAILSGLITMSDLVLVLGGQLWIVDFTDAPRVTVSALLVVNTAMVVLLQVWASRGVDDIAGATRRLKLGPVLTAVACLLFAISGLVNAVVATLVLITAAIVLTQGEMWAAAGIWSLRFALAKPDVQGEYSGMFNLASGIHGIVGPALVTALLSNFRGWGWIMLTAAFIAMALLVAPVVNWGHQRREAESAPVATGATAAA
ncbi:hypothetical protein KRMM14A1259_39620 [Krasilnikovia sp. MM14-A1259]